MKEIIKYPDGSIRKLEFNNNHKNLNKARLGISFEQAINESNEYYLKKEIAVIYKKPTPIQIVKVDYPGRNKAKITEAYFKTPSTTDYNGIYRGKYIDFEAKSCQSNSFSFDNIYDHQIKHLALTEKLGGCSFLLIEFVLKNEVYLFPTKLLVERFNQSLNGGRKSIPYEVFKQQGFLIEIGFKPRIDYLKAVNQYFFNENKE